MRRSYL